MNQNLQIDVEFNDALMHLRLAMDKFLSKREVHTKKLTVGVTVQLNAHRK